MVLANKREGKTCQALFGLTIFILPQLHRLFNLRRNQRRQTRLVKIE
jgi:hypothetical protein